MNATVQQSRIYPWLLVGLLSLNFGIVYLDRMSLNFLMPFMQRELGLSNTAVGAVASGLSLSWALAGLLVGRLSDALGQRKLILVCCALVFSASCGLTGLATSFATLLAARLVMGIAEGGVMPISQALIAAEVPAERRGLAMGVTQIFGANLLANSFGPIVCVAIAVAVGWRRTFYIGVLPGLLLAVLMWAWIRDPPPPARPAASQGVWRAVVEAFGHRNVLVCVILSILLVSFIVVFSVFMPLYLTNVRHLDERTMSWLMSMFGFAALAHAFLVPGASDLLGRRPIVVTMAAAASLLPLSALFLQGSLWPTFVLFGLGAASAAIFPIVMATIPADTVPEHQLATVLALTMGLGEAVGGVASPYLAGWLGDLYGLRATLWFMVCLSVACCGLACTLQESAPAALRRRQARLAPAPASNAPAP